MTFLTPSIIKLQADGQNSSEFSPSSLTNGALTLSDHSRSPLSVSYELIENFQRMANGTARKYVVANKRNFSCSWTMLPTRKSMTINSVNFDNTVDKNADANSMKLYYQKYCNTPLTMTLSHKKNSSIDVSYQESIKVFWSSFSYDVIKRYGDYDYWDVNAEFVEI